LRSNVQMLSKLRFISARRRLELYPPFWLMRIKVLELDGNWDHVRLRLPLNWVSANAAGNMYGGYQACLADPVPALACLRKFPGYRVATKKLELDFIHGGNSDLVLHFDFKHEQTEEIRQELDEHGRATPCFDMAYVREDGKACTNIRNTVAIRPKGYIAPRENRPDGQSTQK